MAGFDDDVDAGTGSQEEDEDDEMEDVNDAEQEAEAEAEDDVDDEDDNDENDNDDNEDDDADDQPPSRRQSESGQDADNPDVTITGASPRHKLMVDWIPPPRPESLTAQAYDIVPTMAAPQSTSINAVAATPDMRWVFSGGTDGYVRMYNWVETANGKVPLTVAQKHPFVDSVMKAGSLVTYWENEETSLRTPQPTDEKWMSPVYSLAVQHEALWLLSGTESGGINLQTCRHQAGTLIATLREHTSAISVLSLSADETQLLSGSWDKTINDWDMQTGKLKRTFRGPGGQISAIEVRPESSLAVPEVAEPVYQAKNATFTSNNTAAPQANGFSSLNGGDEEDAAGSPSSLFGDGSLFGEDNEPNASNGNVFGDDDFTQQLATGLQGEEQDAPGDVELTGGPVQSPRTTVVQDGLPHSDEPLTAPPTGDDEPMSASDLPAQSESIFLDAAINGTLRIWDRRVSSAIATILPSGGTAPWCTGACWSPDGNFFYAGRRGCTVDEYSIHNLGSKKSEPSRVFKFQNGSGPVYAVRAMPNSRNLICASNDILRLYDLAANDVGKHRAVPFTIVPGHRGGVISSIYIDPTCRFMLTAAGNRGWEGNGTEVLLGYEIGVQDVNGIWHK